MDDVHLFTSYFNEIKFGFTPLITRTTFLHPVIEQLELSQILSETDSPYFVPQEVRPSMEAAAIRSSSRVLAVGAHALCTSGHGLQRGRDHRTTSLPARG